MSDELLDVIAAPIRECFGADSPHEHVAMRIAAALKASRHEVVKLPEPMSEGRPEIAAGNGAVTSHDGHDVLIAFPGEAHRWRSPHMARVLAGSILASAANADGAR